MRRDWVSSSNSRRDQLGYQTRKSVGLTVRPSVLDKNGLALNVASLAKAAAKAQPMDAACLRPFRRARSSERTGQRDQHEAAAIHAAKVGRVPH
jgi:hypothetical protein